MDFKVTIFYVYVKCIHPPYDSGVCPVTGSRPAEQQNIVKFVHGAQSYEPSRILGTIPQRPPNARPIYSKRQESEFCFGLSKTHLTAIISKIHACQ